MKPREEYHCFNNYPQNDIFRGDSSQVPKVRFQLIKLVFSREQNFLQVLFDIFYLLYASPVQLLQKPST